MKLSAFWKGLIMAVVGFIATGISQNVEGLNFTYVVISTVGFTLLYIGKNAVFQSTSEPGIVNWQDLLSGIIIAVSMAISSFAASIITTGAVDWQALWIAVVGAVVGYFTKTLPSGTKVGVK